VRKPKDIRNTLSDSGLCQWPGPVARAASSFASSSRGCWEGLFETDEHGSVLKMRGFHGGECLSNLPGDVSEEPSTSLYTSI